MQQQTGSALFWDTPQRINSLPTFRDNLSVPSMFEKDESR